MLTRKSHYPGFCRTSTCSSKFFQILKTKIELPYWLALILVCYLCYPNIIVANVENIKTFSYSEKWYLYTNNISFTKFILKDKTTKSLHKTSSHINTNLTLRRQHHQYNVYSVSIVILHIKCLSCTWLLFSIGEMPKTN